MGIHIAALGNSTEISKTKQTKHTNAEEKKLKKSAEQLEGLFLNYVLKEMRKTIPKEDIHSNTLADMMFSSVMGKALAEHGGVGLSKFLYQALSAEDANAINKLQNGENKTLDLNMNLKMMGSNDE